VKDFKSSVALQRPTWILEYFAKFTIDTTSTRRKI